MKRPSPDAFPPPPVDPAIQTGRLDVAPDWLPEVIDNLKADGETVIGWRAITETGDRIPSNGSPAYQAVIVGYMVITTIDQPQPGRSVGGLYEYDTEGMGTRAAILHPVPETA